MTGTRRRVALSGFGITVLLLAGCAATPAPTPADAVPSEPAAPVAAAEPSFRLGLGCADILDLATVQAQLSEPVSVKIDESSTLSSWDDVNLAQAGGLHCAWGGDDKTDQTYNIGYELWLRPDAQAAFDEWAEGPQSTLNNRCDGSQGYPCSDDFTFQGTWVRAYLSDAGDAAAAASAFSVLNAAVDDALEGRPLADAWPAPASALDVCAEPAATERAAAALGRDPATMIPPQFAPDLTIRTSGATHTCGWYDSADYTTLLQVEQIPGGGWAFARMVSDAPQPFLIEPMAATPIPGAEVAYIGCGDGCAALLKVGDDLVQLDSSYPYRDAFVGIVSAWADAL